MDYLKLLNKIKLSIPIYFKNKIVMNDNMTVKQYIENRLMVDYEQKELFEEAMNKLFEEFDVNKFDIYLQGFDDNTEDEELMFSVVHGIEYIVKMYGIDFYVKKLLNNLKILQPHAYQWSETLILRLINWEDSFNVLKNELKNIDNETATLLNKIINNLILRNPEKFETKGKELLCILRN